MSGDTSIPQGQPPGAADKRLVALFDELEKQQLDFLDQAAKRIIELCTGLLGVLFAVSALGDKFPPPYLAGSSLVKYLVLATLGLYVLALLAALLAVQPRTYKRYEHNLSALREQLDAIRGHKMAWLRAAGGLFFLATVALAALVGLVVWQV